DSPDVAEGKSRSENPANLFGRVAFDDYRVLVDRELSPALESTQRAPRNEKRRKQDDFGDTETVENRTEKRRFWLQQSPNLIGNDAEVRFVTQRKARKRPIEAMFAELVDKSGDLRGYDIPLSLSFRDSSVTPFVFMKSLRSPSAGSSECKQRKETQVRKRELGFNEELNRIQGPRNPPEARTTRPSRRGIENVQASYVRETKLWFH